MSDYCCTGQVSEFDKKVNGHHELSQNSFVCRDIEWKFTLILSTGSSSLANALIVCSVLCDSHAC